MILTGKSKRTFLKWLKIRVNSTLHEIDKIEFWFNLQDESFKIALIIEWFDSVKLFIEISFFNDDYWTYNVYTDHVVLEKEQANICQNREDAIKQAIVKANNIYNEKYSISQ